ncbi:MAG TPA: DUF3047 domain-containing protein [Thermoanaerobaculia bacterium]|nr:DUF3047 domain-containing protein [Thermoanaerobaculia bacterium]
MCLALPGCSAGEPSEASRAATRLVDHLAARRGAEVEAVARLAFAGPGDGWRASSLAVERGQGLTVFGFGQLEAGGRTQTPRDVLWLRIGDGEAFSVGSDADSHRAPRGGDLEVAVRPPGVRWQDCRGTFPTELAGLAAAGTRPDLEVVIATWRAPLDDGLVALADREPVADALADWRGKPSLPSGFQSLCHLRDARVFHRFREAGRVGIRGLATGVAGIVKKPVDVPLGADTELSFEWRYDTLPALGPEDDARHHDYSSIALEFDNGQDLTWMGSGHLAAETAFRCPLRWWDQRETHLVIDSGSEGLGEWRRHRRNVTADYLHAVGGELPGRVVGVWFISVGAFGGGTADATWANVVIRSHGTVTEVFD